ncbi:hypothetical protein Anacy_4541 [Anabaena cylindrica PCC 7122]|uniref:Uncharacterized protein n=1 Tax=Anabaena cylindrica (strain ATCC 27899 / PCC 7122) TaxID=272123 RepID=K9ZNJ1_ANACC|nr:hypothetical protein Anacy_4541 [Anabaena cylindrica PCC 7122]BAY03050.1 hypothetical protein NIES19_23000 [Anabaena cylindrica PCC 7122]
MQIQYAGLQYLSVKAKKRKYVGWVEERSRSVA